MQNLTQRTLLFFALSTPALAQSQTPAEHTSDWQPRNTFERRADFTLDPVPQIQAHLADVVAALAARDATDLAPELRARRAEHIARLVEYADAGVFPRNFLKPTPTPIFIDGDGRACAVGHLMIESGARELAERIALRENTAYVPEIRQAGALDWIRASGLTAEECALIQPAYGPCGGFMPPIHSIDLCSPAERNSTGFAAQAFACGQVQAAQNAVFITVEWLPQNSTGYLLNSQSPGFNEHPAGSHGNLCLGGAIGRHTADVFHTGQGWGPTYVLLDLSAMPTPQGPASVLAGETWYFQCWYRDGASSNFSSAVGVAFQ